MKNLFCLVMLLSVIFFEFGCFEKAEKKEVAPVVSTNSTDDIKVLLTKDIDGNNVNDYIILKNKDHKSRLEIFLNKEPAANVTPTWAEKKWTDTVVYYFDADKDIKIYQLDKDHVMVIVSNTIADYDDFRVFVLSAPETVYEIMESGCDYGYGCLKYDEANKEIKTSIKNLVFNDVNYSQKDPKTLKCIKSKGEQVGASFLYSNTEKTFVFNKFVCVE